MSEEWMKAAVWRVSVEDYGNRSGQATISGPGVYCMQVPVSYSMLDFMQALAAAPAQPAGQEDYPECDYCGVTPDHHPWHGSGLLGGVESRHIHACNSCRHLLPASPAQSEKVAHSAQWPTTPGLSAAPAQPEAHGEFGDAYQGAREDLAIWKRRALEAEEKVRNAEQSTPAAIEVIGYASPGQVEILRSLPRTGGMKVKGCKDGRYTEPVVLLSAARAALFAAVIRCEQAGAFKTCMECGYQDGHDEICKFHYSNRAAQDQDQGEVQRLREALPYLRNAVAEASASGVAQLAVVSTKPDGSGKLVCKFECVEFMADLAAVVGAGPQTEDDDARAEARKFLQRNGIAITGQEVKP